MGTFLVECFWPKIAEERVARSVLDHVDRIVRERPLGTEVRALGCILVPSDGVVLFLFEAANEATLQMVSRWVEVPFDRVVETIHLKSKRFCAAPGSPGAAQVR